jgi:hypothetical protein
MVLKRGISVIVRKAEISDIHEMEGKRQAPNQPSKQDGQEGKFDIIWIQ